MSDTKTAQHTPGPWRVGGDGFGGTQVNRKKIGSNTPITVVSDSGSQGWSTTTYIARIEPGTVEKRLAHAALIAAAPDLLAVCENTAASLAICQMPRLDNDVANNDQIIAIALDGLRAVIGKAKGETT